MGIIKKEDVKTFLQQNVREHKQRQGETQSVLRYEDEILIIKTGTEEYMTGKANMPTRLQDVKDVLTEYAHKTQKNPYNLDLDGGANAKIQKDAVKISRNILLYEGKRVNIVAKHLNRNAVILFDVDLACQLIAEQKDKDKKAEMTTLKDKVLKMPTRAGYGVKSP